MKLSNILLVIITLLFSMRTSAQILQPDANLNYSAEKLNNRGIAGNSSLNLDGNEIIGEYDGNLQLAHRITYKLPNNLDLDYTLIYNANVEHRVFNNLLVNGIYPQDGFMVNAPEWIIGVNGFAVQTLNFENNFYMSDENGLTQGLSGEECPLLIPGYHYSNRLTQYNYNLYGDGTIGKEGFDYIEILMADGSKKTLSNVKFINDQPSSRIGTYVESGLGTGNDGYAIVSWKSVVGGRRKMSYKPGDGLTYYFEEFISDLSFNIGWPGFPGGAHPNGLLRMKLLKIIASNGMYVSLESLGTDFQQAVYRDAGDGIISSVLYLNFEIESSHIKSFIMDSNRGFDKLKATIFDYNQGTVYGSNARSNNSSHSKIKYIEKIEDNEGRANSISYGIFSNRGYKYIHPDPINNFDFYHPIYLINQINYYSGKSTSFEFYNQSFDPSCGTNWVPIQFDWQFVNNGCNMSWANRDNQTNYIIKNRTVSNKFNGIVEPLFSENYNYEIIPHDSQDPNEPMTENIFTTIFKQNLVSSDTSSPSSITKILKFCEFNIRSYYYTGYCNSIDGLFETFPSQFVPRHTKSVKLVQEKVQSSSSERIKDYEFEYSIPRSMNYVEGTLDLKTIKESVNGLPQKTTSFSYEYLLKSISQTGTITAQFNSKKNLLQRRTETTPSGISSEKNFQTEFFDYQDSDISTHYSLNSLVLEKVFAGSIVKSQKTFDYNYSTLNGGYGKLKWIKNLDPILSNRETKLEFYYYDDPFSLEWARLGALKRNSYDNGLTKEYFYPVLDENFSEPGPFVPCTWVKFDGTTLYSPSYLLFSVYHYNSYPYKINTTLSTGTLTTYQGVDQPFQPAYLVDENGYISQYIFDNAGRILLNNLPGSFTNFPNQYNPPNSNNSKIYTYFTNPNHILEITRFSNDPLLITNLESLSEYDGLNNLREFSISTNESYEIKKIKKYNFLGLVSEETDGSGITTRYKYDFLGRPLIKHYNDNTKDKYQYFAFSGTVDGKAYYEKMKFTDASGKVKETYYDISGNVVAEKSGTNNATIFNFNTINQLSSYKSPMGKITAFQYDGYGNIKQKISPDGGTINYKYDKWGNLRFSLNAAASSLSKELTFNKYDQLGRLVITGLLAAGYGFDVLNPDLDYSTVQAGKGPFENYSINIENFVLVNMYDDYSRTGVFANLPNFAFGTLQNLKGRLVATAFREGTNAWSYKIYSYDYLGRIKDEYVFFQSTSAYKKITNEYDKLNNIVKQNVDNVFYYWYSFDEQNRLKTVKSNKIDASPILEAVYNYGPSDKVLNLQLGTMGAYAPRLNYSYDNKGRLYDINGIASDLFTSVYRQTLTYFNNDNVNTMYLKNDGNGNWSDLYFSYVYDDLNKLTSASCNYPVYNETYTYDNDGNFITKNRPYDVSKNITYSYNSNSNQLDYINIGKLNIYEFQYDYDGNLKTDPRKSFTSITYDRRNLIYNTYVNSVLKYGFFYDDAGNRICKKQLSPTVQEYYLRDHTGRELAVYDWVTGKLKLVNLYGNGLIGKVNVSYDAQNNRTDARQYYFKDHLGSIRMILNANTFDIAGAQDFYPYGEILRQYTTGGNVNDKYKFTEKERDTETNYDYFGARYYDSELARWLSVDPLADKYPGWSPYNYCLNNPLIIVDPDGMDTTSRAASATYDAYTKNETITETIEQHLNPGTKNFAIIKTTNTATIDKNGNLIISQTTSSFTNTGTSTTLTNNPTLSIFSAGVASIVNSAVNLRSTTGLSWSTTLVNEFNQVQATQVWKDLGWNLGTAILFPPSFATNGLAATSVVNLSLSGYSILDAARGYGFEHSNVFQPIYQWKK